MVFILKWFQVNVYLRSQEFFGLCVVRIHIVQALSICSFEVDDADDTSLSKSFHCLNNAFSGADGTFLVGKFPDMLFSGSEQ